jgi:protein arginine kinase activator
MMNCQRCHEKPATLHFTKIINGEKTESHLCEHCARDSNEASSFQSNFSINHFLSGLLNGDPSFTNRNNSKQHTLTCERCGMTLNQFIKSGRFGCSNCYTTFTPHYEPLLKRVHSGNTEHKGKIPKRIGKTFHVRIKIDNLRKEMQTYIEQEEFEMAAETRDKIRLLEKQLINKGEEK